MAADGSKKGDHMDAARRHPLFKASEEPEPRCPIEVEYLWDWFCRIAGKRQIGMAANALASSEILDWQRRYRLRFEPFEESVIDRLDSLYLSIINKKADS